MATTTEHGSDIAGGEKAGQDILEANAEAYQVRSRGLLKAGFGKRSILPDWPVTLSYGAEKPTTRTLGIPYVRAIVWQVGEERVAMLEYDVIGLRDPEVRRIKVKLAQEVGIPERHLIVAATHNHNYPRTWEPRIAELLAERGAEALKEAVDSMKASRMGVKRAIIREDLNTNRAELHGLSNSVLYLVRFEDEAGNLSGLMYNYGSHPVIFTKWGNEPGALGPDWPGYVSSYVQGVLKRGRLYDRYTGDEKSEPEPFVMMSEGAAGDQEPRRSHYLFNGDPAPGNQAFMNKLAEVILEESHDITTESEFELELHSRRVGITGLDGRQESVLLQSMRLNDTVFSTVPGELGVDLHRLLEEKSPYPNNIPITVSDGYIGYIVPERLGWEAVTYQAKSSDYHPHTGIQLINAHLKMQSDRIHLVPHLNPTQWYGSLSGKITAEAGRRFAVGVHRIPRKPDYYGGFWGRRTVADESGNWRIDSLMPGDFYLYLAEVDPQDPGPAALKTPYKDRKLLFYGYPVSVLREKETGGVNFTIPRDYAETGVESIALLPDSLVLDGYQLTGQASVVGERDPDLPVIVGLYRADYAFPRLEPFLSHPVLRTTLDANGRFLFESIPPGQYRVVLWLDVNRNNFVERQIDRFSRFSDSPLVRAGTELF